MDDTVTTLSELVVGHAIHDAEAEHTRVDAVRTIDRVNTAELRHTVDTFRHVTRVNTAEARYTTSYTRQLDRVNAAEFRHRTDYLARQLRADFDGFNHDKEILTAMICKWVDEEHAPAMLQIFQRILEEIRTGGTYP